MICSDPSTPGAIRQKKSACALIKYSLSRSLALSALSLLRSLHSYTTCATRSALRLGGLALEAGGARGVVVVAAARAQPVTRPGVGDVLQAGHGAAGGGSAGHATCTIGLRGVALPANRAGAEAVLACTHTIAYRWVGVHICADVSPCRWALRTKRTRKSGRGTIAQKKRGR